MSDYVSGMQRLQVEMSTVCNALCLGCVRTDTSSFNRTKPYIPKARFLDIQLLLDLIVSQQGRRLRALEFCGNIDEPLAHPGLLELLERAALRRPDLRISIHTNGGIGGPEKFRALTRVMRKFERGVFRFSIDGLEDTNHIYRQGVKWTSLMANLEACLSEGADVTWQYLIFPWNEHQTAEAKQLAAQMGCRRFWLRPDRSEVSHLGLDKVQALKLRNSPSASRPEGTIRNFRFYPQNRDRDISCSFRDEGMLFLSWEGKVWPCCFISNVLYESESKIRMMEKYLLARYPANFNNLHHHSFDEILSSPFFRRDLVNSWSETGRAARMKWRCVERCSVARRRSSDGKVDDRTHLARVTL